MALVSIQQKKLYAPVSKSLIKLLPIKMDQPDPLV
jgi:hypothetical protein